MIQLKINNTRIKLTKENQFVVFVEKSKILFRKKDNFLVKILRHVTTESITTVKYIIGLWTTYKFVVEEKSIKTWDSERSWYCDRGKHSQFSSEEKGSYRHSGVDLVLRFHVTGCLQTTSLYGFGLPRDDKDVKEGNRKG